MQPQTRAQLIQKIHIGKNELGMDRNTYVAFLLETVDKHSCTVMNNTELMTVLQKMQAKGFVVKSKQGKRPPVSQYDPNRKQLMNKIGKLLEGAGKPWGYAQAIAKKAFGIERLQWCTDEQLHKLIQMLAVNAHKHGRRTK